MVILLFWSVLISLNEAPFVLHTKLISPPNTYNYRFPLLVQLWPVVNYCFIRIMMQPLWLTVKLIDLLFTLVCIIS